MIFFKLLSTYKNYLIVFLLPVSFLFGQAYVSILLLLFVVLFFLLLDSFKKLPILNDTIIVSIFIFFTFLIISSILNIKKEFAANIFSLDSYNFQLIFDSVRKLSFLFFFFCLYILLSKEKFFFLKNLQNSYFKFLSIIILFLIFDSLFQFMHPNRENLFGFKPTDLNTEMRLTSVFNNEPIVGSFLFHMGLVPMIFLIYYIKDKIKNFFYLFLITNLLILTYLITVFLSGERISFLMTLSSVIFILLSFKDLRKYLISLFFFSIFFLIIIFNNSYFNDRYKILYKEISGKMHDSQPVFDEKNSKYRDRSFFDSQWGAHYLTAYEMFKNYPFFGVGIRQFRYKCQETKYEIINSEAYKMRCSSHPHNLYAEILSETGLFCFLSFLSILLFITIRVIRVIKEYKFEKSNYLSYRIFLSTAICVLFIFIPIKSTGSFFSNFYGTIIWLNITFLFTYLKFFEKNLNIKKVIK